MLVGNNESATTKNEGELLAFLIAMRLQQLLDTPVADYQACLALVEVKLARIQESPHYIDSYIDACAYIALAGMLATEGELDGI